MIADNALLGGFATGQRPVGSALVREVCRDFRIDAEPWGERVQPSPVLETPKARAQNDTKAGPGRTASLLGIERHGFEPSGVTRADQDEEQTSREEMFESVQPKRKRFLFFGSR